MIFSKLKLIVILLVFTVLAGCSSGCKTQKLKSSGEEIVFDTIKMNNLELEEEEKEVMVEEELEGIGGGSGGSSYDNWGGSGGYSTSSGYEEEYPVSSSAPTMSPRALESSPVMESMPDAMIETETVSYSSVEIPQPRTNYPVGKISYSIPDTMEYDKEERVVLRIARNEIDSILGNRNGIPTKCEFIIVKQVRVGNLMSAELIDVSTKKSFEIKELSSKQQNIETHGYTEWQWIIKPLKSGSKPLKLLIKVVITTEDGKTAIKDIPVFEKQIFVYAKPVKTVWNFFKNYWQWFSTVLLIPLFKYFYAKRKKKKEED